VYVLTADILFIARFAHRHRLWAISSNTVIITGILLSLPGMRNDYVNLSQLTLTKPWVCMFQVTFDL